MGACVFGWMLCLCVFVKVESMQIVDLRGLWNVSNTKHGISVPGQVPGSMYTALLDNKVIEDPLYRDNDVKLAWIGNENWTYTRYFNVDNSVWSSQSILLVAEGLDTIATVYINEIKIGRSENMFVRNTFDVKSAVKPGNNSIKVVFESAVGFAAKQAQKIPYTIPPECPSQVQNGQCHVNLIRKEQCSFSWDWGPSFPTQGIWKPIYLVAFNSAVIEDATVDAFQDGNSWNMDVHVFFNVVTSGTVTGQLDIRLNDTNVLVSKNVTLSPSSNDTSITVSIPQSVGIKRWWPNGYGNQSLYDVLITFTADVTKEVSSVQRRIGFRTIELIQKNVSSDPNHGLTFFVRVNGIPIFLKGSNWIPADSFQERITKERLRLLLQSAADAHMNSMRVWGGGVFESEDFYDLADELGILIWQDMMFSVAMYPTTSDFLNSVTQELRYQIRRLMHRPSILLWAGSNENEKALRQNWFGTSSNYTLYYNDFITLYVKTVMAVVQQENPRRQYLSSSPSNGLDSEREGFVAQDPDSELYGDIHFYDYLMNQWKPDNFRIPRMATEYGIQAWCNVRTLQDVFEEADMSYCSAQADHRQHHRGGSVEMSAEILLHLDLPKQGDQQQYFRNYIYLTQINQAMSIKTQSEHYRRYQSKLLPDGRGLTMGALYWQLNDIWQAPTWASIDYSGRWKMLHYYALKFFNPLLVSPVLVGNNLQVHIVADEIPIMEVQDPSTHQLRFEPVTLYSDLVYSEVDRDDVPNLLSKTVHAVEGLLTVEIYSWKKFQPLASWSVSYKLNTTAEVVFERDVNSMLTEAGCKNTECFLFVYINNQIDGTNNWLSFADIKDSSVQKAQIAITDVTQVSEHEFTITLASNSIAPFVWLEAGDTMGRFSDNGFLMMQPKVSVQFYAWQDVDLHSLRSALSVKSVMDIYS
ncbi:beta-mannosidase-like isoform X2 [Pomacea canaliculata]|uniref:beta-mannosidase-like isoform X2 n=1 Tax=Pomacea canaliculata TaxID=400727 RepID=UPI000D73B828|nr:beta-mannosidase-like isoform X2 [Pomacea canaliculata]